MKFYSDLTKRIYETEEELKEAERAQEEKNASELAKKEARAAKAKEVEELYKKANEAYKLANEKMNEFVKEYGAFHASITDSNLPSSATNLFDVFFNRFWF